MRPDYTTSPLTEARLRQAAAEWLPDAAALAGELPAAVLVEDRSTGTVPYGSTHRAVLHADGRRWVIEFVSPYDGGPSDILALIDQGPVRVSALRVARQKAARAEELLRLTLDAIRAVRSATDLRAAAATDEAVRAAYQDMSARLRRITAGRRLGARADGAQPATDELDARRDALASD